MEHKARQVWRQSARLRGVHFHRQLTGALSDRFLAEFMSKYETLKGNKNAAKDESEKKNTKIQIRCTVVQKEMITDQASKQGKTISNYLLELAEKDNNLA